MKKVSDWLVDLSTGRIGVRAWSRSAAIKRAIQEEHIRVGGKVLRDRMGIVGVMRVTFGACIPMTWWERKRGFEIDFDDTIDRQLPTGGGHGPE